MAMASAEAQIAEERPLSTSGRANGASKASITSSAAKLMAPGSTASIPPHLASPALRIAVTAASLGVLLGLVLPRAVGLVARLVTAMAETEELPSAHKSIGDLLLLPQLHLYLAAWALFHLLEFVITARWNPTRLYADSFLLQNGISYHIAHVCGVVEFLLEAKYQSSWKSIPRWYIWLGLAMLITGQLVRSFAMVHAAGNFSHEVATRKRDDHRLVTDGIYGYARHPSYAGFFYWALGTQVLLANPLGAAVFAVVLWRFFHDRIKGEEAHLVYFFKDQYTAYRDRTSTLIPFIA